MKYFVKWCSLLCLIVLIIVNLIEFSGVICDIGISVTRLKEATPSYIDGSEATLFDGLLTAFTGFVIAILGVLALIVIAEMVAKILICRNAIKKNAYKYYKIFSIFGILEIIFNAFASFLIIGLMAGEMQDFQDAVEKTVFALFLAKVFVLFWLIPDFLGARQCVKDGL